MLEKIVHKFTGFVNIRINGIDKFRFLNIAIKNGINFWDYKKDEENLTVSLRIRDYRKLMKLRKKYNISIRINSKKGLPFQTNKLRKRYGILVGIIVAIAIYVYLSSCFWVVDIKNNGAYSDEYILDIAKDCGVYEGAFKKDVNEDIVAFKMMKILPEIKWITLNSYGSCVEILLEYADNKPEVVDNDGVVNLIASETGLVKFIVPENGVALVEVGEAVHKGEVLISGTWDSNRGKDDWKMREEPEQYFSHARGIVMAEVDKTFIAKIPKIKKEYTEDERYEKYKFGFFGLTIPFTFKLVPSGEYHYDYEKNNLYLLGTKLPIYLEKQELTKLIKVEKIYTDEEVKKELRKLIEKQTLEIGEGNSILSEGELFISEDDFYYYGEIHYNCLLNIAIEDKIAVK